MHHGKGLISIFQEAFANINKMFILEGRPDAGVSFDGVHTLSWYFLISEDPFLGSATREGTSIYHVSK